MEQKYLFERERLISQSDNNEITLTSHRIRYNSSSTGRGHVISIALEKISSIEIHYKSWILVLLLGILFVGAGIIIGANNNGEAMILVLILGGVCILLYFLTRKHVVTISSDGGAKINFETKGMKRETLLDFINKIEVAKSNRTK